MADIDTGAYLSSLMAPAAASSAPVPANIDQQIMMAMAQKPSQLSASAATTPPTGKPFASWANWMPKPLQQFTAGAESAAPYYYDQARKSLGLPQNQGREAAEDQAQQPMAGKIGNWTASALMGAPIGAAAALAAPELGLGAVGGGLLGSVAGGAAQGALLSPAGSRGTNALIGGLTAGLLHGATAGAGKLVSGLLRTPQAQQLLDRGVQLTPGQMNSGGLYNKLEQGLTGLPFVGGKIAAARAAAAPAVTRSLLNDALAPGDTLGTGDLNSMVSSMQTGFDNAYDSSVHGFGAKPAIVRIKGGDVPLSDAFDSVANTPRQGLTQAQRATMGQQLQDQLTATIQVANGAGGMLTDHLQTLRSSLRELAREAPATGNTGTATRNFWNAAQEKVTDALDSQLPPKAAALLKATDAQYAKFQTVQDAVAAGKDKPPTLAQLSAAVKSATPPKLYAAGGGFGRDVTKAATGVLGNDVPLTGLTGAGTIQPIMRTLEGGLGLGGAAALGHPLSALGAAGGLAGLYGAYTQPGLRALAGQTAPQKAIQGLMSNLSPQMRKLLPLLMRSGGVQAALQEGQGGLLGPSQVPQ